MSGLSGIVANKGASGLGRRLTSNDGISGIIFYNDTLPSGFGVSDRAKKVFSLAEAEDLGIVDSNALFEVDHYHISEFFRQNPSGSLWVGYYAVPVGAYDFDEIVELQNSATDEISLFAVYTPAQAFASAQVTALQAKMTEIDVLNAPAVAFYAADFSAVADLTTLTDLRTLTAPDVCVVIGQDFAGTGAALYASKAYSITSIGACLGLHSKIQVNESAGNVEFYNVSGTEMTVAGYANGQSYRALTKTASGAIKDKGYLINRDYLSGVAGTYFERVPMSVVSSSDYAFIENRRVVNKVQRLLVTAYTPKLNSVVVLNEDGEISTPAVVALEDIGRTQLEGMRAAGEISNGSIAVDPSQDILATSTLVVSASVQPTANAEFITININLVPEIS